MTLKAKKTPLTLRQRSVLDFIVRSLETKMVCPSQREIASALGLSVPNIFYYMRVLKKKGYIKTSSKHRSIKVIHC